VKGPLAATKTRESAIRIVRDLPKAEVYLTGGPSGAGKTVFSRVLATTSGSLIISLDNYFVDAGEVRTSSSSQFGVGPQWDHPSSVDLELALRNTVELLETGRSELPLYSFASNTRTGSRRLKRSPGQPVLVEGIHALLLRRCLVESARSVFSIFVDCSVQIRHKRVRVRDAETRGRPLHQFEKRFHFMRIAERRWILKQRAEADLVLDTSEDSFRIVAYGPRLESRGTGLRAGSS